MGQIPTSEETFGKLNFFRIMAMKERKTTTTWDNVISAMVDVCNKHTDEFVLAVKAKKGKKAKVIESGK